MSIETIKIMIKQAKHNVEETKELKHLDLQYQYWKGRLEGLEDALKAFKIEKDWCEVQV